MNGLFAYRTKRDPAPSRQQGAVTIFVTLIILISATLVMLFTSRALIFEQKVNANQYRYQQAASAAKAALDEAFAYINAVGGAVIPADSSDLHTALVYQLTAADISGTTTDPGQVLCAQWSVVEETDRPYIVTAIGYSDDYSQDPDTPCTPGAFTGYAQHTIIQDLQGAIALFGGPRQPLIARGLVGVTGDFNIVNAYWNATVWSGRSVSIGESVSARTYVDNPTDLSAPESITTDIFQHLDTDPRIALASGKTLGNNIDIIESDPGLRNLTEAEFFSNFFYESKETMAAYAESLGQRFDAADNPDIDGLSGYIWIDVADGDSYTLNGGTMGSADNPAIIMVDGALSTTGTPGITGILYCAGNWTAAGTTTVEGTVIVGGTDVGGAGGVNLLYNPTALSPGTPPPGSAAAVPYSWHDWN